MEIIQSFFPPGNVDTRDLENQFLKMSINKEIASHQNTQATLAFCRHICSTQRQEMANQERIAAANKKVILSLRDEVWEAEVRRSASQRVAQVNVTAQLRRYQEDYLAKTQKVRDVYLEIQQWVNAHKEDESSCDIELPNFEPLSTIVDLTKPRDSYYAVTPQAMAGLSTRSA